MSEPLSALPGARFEGFCTIEEAGLVGMITLRGDLTDARLAGAVRAATGADLPGRLAITSGEAGQVAWMSPDELLLFVDYPRAGAVVAALEADLAGLHALAVDVSDARAVFRVAGPRAGEVLGKLTPMDLRGLAPGDFRRTRLAQVPAAIWQLQPDELRVMAFRSVARYVFDILRKSATPGGEVWP